MERATMKARASVRLVIPVLFCLIPAARAQTAPGGSGQASQSDGFFADWLRMVSRYGGGKGLELIPQKNIEVIVVAPPAYLVHNNPAVLDGFGDWSFLVKYRMLSENEEHGNFILTAFLQVTFPTGQYKNGATNTIITPTIAYGKGFGRFDVQGTFGATLPTGNEANIGRTFPWNNAFQYHIHRRLWPEVEVNYTHFQDGPNNGKTQVFLTPGILFGRFHLWKRLALTAGGGFQIATTHFHTNNHNGILTVRFPF